MTIQEKLLQAANLLRTEGNQPWNIGLALAALCEWAASQSNDEETK